jgi:hypothetical protein
MLVFERWTVFTIWVFNVLLGLSSISARAADCPVQPTDVRFMQSAMQEEISGFGGDTNEAGDCLFKFFDVVDLSKAVDGTSSVSADILNVRVEVNEFSTVPSAQIFSHCSNCVYEWGGSAQSGGGDYLCHNSNGGGTNNRCFVGYTDVLRSIPGGMPNASQSASSGSILSAASREFIFPPEYYVSTSVLISGSLWSEFFHYDSTDQYRLVINPTNREVSAVDVAIAVPHRQPFPAFMVTNPVYIIPMITFHVGHVLIDVLEQVYHSMVAHYGEVRRDSLLIFDVAGASEKGVLIRKLRSHLYDPKHDLYAVLLRLLTRNPIITIDSLQDDRFFGANGAHHRVVGRSNSILFADLHIGRASLGSI